LRRNGKSTEAFRTEPEEGEKFYLNPLYPLKSLDCEK
jgi:hypothetical protein